MPQTPPAAEESNPVILAAIGRRRRALWALLIFNLAAVVLFASLRVRASTADAAWLGYELGFEPFSTSTWITGALILLSQLIISHGMVLSALSSDDARRLHPPPESDAPIPQPTGAADSSRIAELVHEVARSCGIQQVDEIYYILRPIPNAFTVRLFGSGNIVALNSNLFDFLGTDGVRAVVAHELAHIKHRDSLIRQLVMAPTLHVALILTWGFLQILSGLLTPESAWIFTQRLGFLVVFALLGLIVFALIGTLATRAARLAELLADAFAGRVCGLVSTANMLLLLGERTEALTALVEKYKLLVAREGDDERGASEAELRRILGRFPRAEVHEEVTHKLVPELFIRDRLETLREHFAVPLDDQDIEDLARRGARALVARMAEEKSAKAAETAAAQSEAGTQAETDEEQADPLLDWRSFDFDHSGHLDAQELPHLFEKLRASPERMLFRQFLDPDSRNEDHPPIRERLLFVAEVLAAEPA